jgi:hypothetical protein
MVLNRPLLFVVFPFSSFSPPLPFTGSSPSVLIPALAPIFVNDTTRPLYGTKVGLQPITTAKKAGTVGCVLRFFVIGCELCERWKFL